MGVREANYNGNIKDKCVMFSQSCQMRGCELARVHYGEDGLFDRYDEDKDLTYFEVHRQNPGLFS
jgi:hypothetical protein